MDRPLFWVLATIACLMIHAFFTMVEMATVSFNKVRLEYYVAQGRQRAIWLSDLLKNPARLFGTTLLGVNIALQVGSECSRQVYESLSLPPDLSAVTQVVLVLLFAELSPMFAARRYPEHVAKLGVPIVYACSRIAMPLIWAIGVLSRLINRLIGEPNVGTDTFLGRDELQSMLEENDEGEPTEDLDVVVGNIFSLRRKTAKQVMEPLNMVQMVDASCTVGHMRQLLRHAYFPYLPVYQGSRRNVVKIAYPRDLINTRDDALVRSSARAPWFLAQHTKILEILQQFRRNKQSVAVVLDHKGLAVGILTLDDILDEIFGEREYRLAQAIRRRPRTKRFIERSFPGHMSIEDFNRRYEAKLEHRGVGTLAQLMTKVLGHHPEKGENIRVQEFLLTAEETSLLGAKVISIRSVQD